MNALEKIEQMDGDIQDLKGMVESNRDKIDEHIKNENDHLEHVRDSLHEMRDSLQDLQNPIITVKNGEEKPMYQKEAIAELWAATYPLRLLGDILLFLNNHKFIKWFVVLIFIFAIIGIVSTPFSAAMDIIAYVTGIKKN